jgi:Txe/YoeB family toxin of Txe-Axe toxin-antitoxin module
MIFIQKRNNNNFTWKYKMNPVINDIANEWSRRIPSGIIDLKNEQHIAVVHEIMQESIGDKEVINSWINNLIDNERL